MSEIKKELDWSDVSKLQTRDGHDVLFAVKDEDCWHRVVTRDPATRVVNTYRVDSATGLNWSLPYQCRIDIIPRSNKIKLTVWANVYFNKADNKYWAYTHRTENEALRWCTRDLAAATAVPVEFEVEV